MALKVKKLKTKTLKKKVLKSKVFEERELKIRKLYAGKGHKIITCSDCGKDMVVGSEAQGGRCQSCCQKMLFVLED